MRVLDLGCGRAKSSIFLAREFGVQVWATDLWISASENIRRIRDAQLEDRVFPLHADARSLPFAAEFFDAIICVDCYPYFGTDDLYLNYLVQFVKPGRPIGIAGAGLTQEFDGDVPSHFTSFTGQDCRALHTAAWWRHHWERLGLVDIVMADTMPDGWQVWRDWDRANGYEENVREMETDAGRYLGYVRMVGHRRHDNKLEDYCWPDTLKSSPFAYEQQPLLREG